MSESISSLAWLAALGSREELTEIGRTPRVLDANAHLHLPPNFSAFSSMEQAVSLAAEQNVSVLGTSNYYDYSLYSVFQRECRTHGIFPIFGTEIITFDRELAKQGVLSNDPKNPGKMYICGKGITRFLEPTPEAQQTLDTIKGNDRTRIAEMVRRVIAHMAANGLALKLTDSDIIDSIVIEYQVPRETVTLQERHVARALQQAIFQTVPVEKRKPVLAPVFGAEPTGIDDPVKMQDEIRGHIMKSGRPGYVDETFITLPECIKLILELGGVPCYPTLADGANPIGQWESPPDKLAERAIENGMYTAEFIPIRNKLSLLTEYVTTIRKHGLVLTAGTEHNTLSMIQMPPFCIDAPLSDELKAIFWEGTCVMAAHQYLASQGLCGYVDKNGNLNPAYSSVEERITDFRQLGEGVIQAYLK